MADVVLGLGTGHASTLGTPPAQVKKVAERDVHDPRMDYAALLRAAPDWIQHEIADEKIQEHYEACLRGVERLDAVLREVAPDVLVVVGDDQHEQFMDDNLPTFGIFRGSDMPIVHRTYPWSDPSRDWDAGDTRTSLPGEPDLADHLLRFLCEAGFDFARADELRRDIGLGHAFVNPYRRYLPDRTIPMVPIMVNTYFPPNQPTPRRCYQLGRVLREAIEAWNSPKRVAIVASGGLSHAVIDQQLDWVALNAMKDKDADTLCSLPVEQLIRGTSEIRNWVVAAGAMEPLPMTVVDYVPYYRSPAGTGCAGGFAYWRDAA